MNRFVKYVVALGMLVVLALPTSAFGAGSLRLAMSDYQKPVAKASNTVQSVYNQSFKNKTATTTYNTKYTQTKKNTYNKKTGNLYIGNGSCNGGKHQAQQNNGKNGCKWYKPCGQQNCNTCGNIGNSGNCGNNSNNNNSGNNGHFGNCNNNNKPDFDNGQQNQGGNGNQGDQNNGAPDQGGSQNPGNDNQGNDQNSGNDNANGTVTGTQEQQVAALVNQERAAQGLSGLKLNSALSKVAEAKAADMRDKGYFSHTSPTYGSPFDMMKSFGISYSSAGENIAKGYKTASAVMDGWMNSSGHRANILNSKYTKIGVGYVTDASGNSYWVQMFIRP